MRFLPAALIVAVTFSPSTAQSSRPVTVTCYRHVTTLLPLEDVSVVLDTVTFSASHTGDGDGDAIGVVTVVTSVAAVTSAATLALVSLLAMLLVSLLAMLLVSLLAMSLVLVMVTWLLYQILPYQFLLRRYC